MTGLSVAHCAQIDNEGAGMFRPIMRRNTLGSSVAAGVTIVQLGLYLFIAIYAFAGWTFAGDLISLKTVVLLAIAGLVLPRLAAMIPGGSRYRSRPNRLILASL